MWDLQAEESLVERGDRRHGSGVTTSAPPQAAPLGRSLPASGTRSRRGPGCTIWVRASGPASGPAGWSPQGSAAATPSFESGRGWPLAASTIAPAPSDPPASDFFRACAALVDSGAGAGVVGSRVASTVSAAGCGPGLPPRAAFSCCSCCNLGGWSRAVVAGSRPFPTAAVAAAVLATGLPLTSEFAAGAAGSPGGVLSSSPPAAGVAARVTGSESVSTIGIAEAGAACLCVPHCMP